VRGSKIEQLTSALGQKRTFPQCSVDIDGSFSFGQYIRNVRMNLPVGAGSQFDSLSAPGEVFTGDKPDLCEARNFWSICRRG
jgi:hypothetical protein